MARLLSCVLAVLAWLALAPVAQGAVTVTFWSHEFGNSFPHAFITLRGTAEAGGAPVDTAIGFTAASITPALLMGDVGGRIETPKPGYVDSSDAQFAVVLTDAQYAGELALARAWGAPGTRYNLGKRNCIHFVREALRIAGLTGLDFPKLMKKPRSYLLAVGAANAGAVLPVGMKGRAYRASLPPLAPLPPPVTLPVLPLPPYPPTPDPKAPYPTAPDLHVAPPPPRAQSAGTISMTSSVEAKPG